MGLVVMTSVYHDSLNVCLTCCSFHLLLVVLASSALFPDCWQHQPQSPCVRLMSIGYKTTADNICEASRKYTFHSVNMHLAIPKMLRSTNCNRIWSWSCPLHGTTSIHSVVTTLAVTSILPETFSMLVSSQACVHATIMVDTNLYKQWTSYSMA